ncbi:MAG: hypothetical protein EXR47_05445 [Dehalococcoidia bacterium]|nr:hypothetical protein [Dehalococcoidia bacterium]
MTTLVAVSPKELMHEHLIVLREYARQVLVRRETLRSRSDSDWRLRMAEFLAIGATFRLVYHDLFAAKPQCGCSSCRARAEADHPQTPPDEAARHRAPDPNANTIYKARAGLVFALLF